MTEILENIVSEARKVASENPDFIYKSKDNGVDVPPCLYQEKNGSCGCIFGHVLKRLGLLPLVLEEFPDQAASIPAISQSLGFIQTKNDRRLADWCGYVQAYQDEGYTWQEAIKRADRQYPDLGH